MATPTLGEQLLQQLTLGLTHEQQEVNVYPQVARLPLPREDGYLVDRNTGQIVNEFPYDNPYIESLTNYKTILSKDPDFELVRVVGGLMGIDPFELVRGDSHARFQRVSETIRDVLRDNMKKRGVTVGQRRELLTTLTTQQVALRHVRERLQEIYETMAPTVKRWAFLASMTGYHFNPTIAPDAAFAELGAEADPVPYWLVVRYIRQQYAAPGLLLRNFAMHDSLYWEAYRPKFGWALRLLEMYQQTILTVLKFDDVTRRLANLIYLLLRDVALSTCLRLVPPVSLQVVIPAKSKKGDLISDIEGFQPLDSATSDLGRYRSLPYYLEQTRFALADNLSPVKLRLEAISRREAANFPPDPFGLTPEPERKLILKKAVVEARSGAASQSLLIDSLYLLNQGDIPWKKQVFDKAPVSAAFIAWTEQCNAFSDALFGFSLDGLGEWVRLMRFVLAPAAAGGNQTKVAVFLLTQAQQLVHSIDPDADINGHVAFAWGRADDVEVANDTPDFVTMNILGHLLFVREEVEPRAIPVTHRDNRRRVFTAVTETPDDVGLAITSDAEQIADAVYTGMRITVPLTFACTSEWEKLLPLTTTLANAIAAASHAAMPAKIREAIDVCLSSLILWSRFMQNMRVASGFIQALYTDLLQNANAADTLAELMKRSSFIRKALRDYAPLMTELNRYRDVAAHFYHEVFRSTFLSPYDRTKIHADKLVGADDVDEDADVKKGDVLEDAVLERKDSDNQTAFENETWEKLYANLFHAPVGEFRYWRAALTSLVGNLTVDPAKTPGKSIFSSMWTPILAVPRYWTASPINDQGVPDFTQLRLALTPAGGVLTQEAIVQQAFYQSLAYTLRKRWNPAIIPDRLRQTSVLEDNDASESIPSIDLLHHMIIFTLAYYPHMRERMLTRQSELDKSIADANDFLRSVAANDHNYAVSQVNDIIRNLYVPEREWHMQGLLTGHLEIVAMVTSALGYAYNALQDLAYKTASESDRNDYNKRARTLTLDYSNLKEVPLDVISAYNGKDATRDRIDDTYTTESTLGQLRNTIGELIKQCICHTRLDVPEQYKTMIQYERSPIGLSNALRAMLRFRFTSLGARLWKVDRV